MLLMAGMLLVGISFLSGVDFADWRLCSSMKSMHYECASVIVPHVALTTYV
jgi:hypothetical protein